MSDLSCDILPAGGLDPCILVIFGASGDLTRRKLIPALFSMFRQDLLPRPFTIVGCSRTEMDSDTFRHSLRQQMDDGLADAATWTTFASLIHYHPVRYDRESFTGLRAFLQELDRTGATGGNRVFDLAVPPQLYPVIATLLGETGLAREGEETGGWSRIVIEKPFGHDLESARELNRTLHRYFREPQIFRIDHYLAKETVQNMLVFRFANSIFEPIWNRHHISYAGIMAAESLGIGNRAGYYEEAGVLRDMFQNHLMQLLVLTGMEPPCLLEPDPVQDEKVKVIRSLRDFNTEHGSRICLGQYTAGEIDQTAVPGYRQEQGVDPRSRTPTFALLELYVDNWRWQNVPFLLVSGKRLPRKVTRIVIQFRDVPHRLFTNLAGESIGANRLTIETYPDEAIRLTFQSKQPGASLCLRSMTMDFTYAEHYRKSALDAYARVLLDCMAGDHMLFWRQDGIEQSWAFLTPVLRQCEQCLDRETRLHSYPAGTWGPAPVRQTVEELARP
ncbi:glucose-6-phosphate dehydrogenase [Thermodesulfobacteriota bacterium B35]